MRQLICLVVACLLLGCTPTHKPFIFDAGDDPVEGGLYRIVDAHDRMGYADATGRVVIRPQYAFGFPFYKDLTEVTYTGELREVPGSGGEHTYWESDDWFMIDKQGNKVDSPPRLK